MTIGICDDQAVFLEHLTNRIGEYLAIRHVDANLVTYHDGVALAESDRVMDILFLDVEMDAVSGIEIKNRFFEQRKDTAIIFVSGHPEYTREMIGKNVYHFLEKPVRDEELFKALDECIAICRKDTMIEIDEAGEWYRLDYRKIKYIIAEDQYTKVYTETNEYLFRKKLKDWEELLPKDFFAGSIARLWSLFHILKRNRMGFY